MADAFCLSCEALKPFFKMKRPDHLEFVRLQGPLIDHDCPTLDNAEETATLDQTLFPQQTVNVFIDRQTWCITESSNACFESLLSLFKERKELRTDISSNKKFRCPRHLCATPNNKTQPKVGDKASLDTLKTCFGRLSPHKLRSLDFGTGLDAPSDDNEDNLLNWDLSFFMCLGEMFQTPVVQRNVSQ